jgi:hypothetical protein
MHLLRPERLRKISHALKDNIENKSFILKKAAKMRPSFGSGRIYNLYESFAIFISLPLE